MEIAVPRTKLQIDISDEARAHIKALAYSKGMTLTEYVITAIADKGDAKAKKLLEKRKLNKQKIKKASN